MSLSSPVMSSRLTIRRIASRTFEFDTFTVDMKTCHGEAHVSCLQTVSSDFQLLHLHKLLSDTIFFVTDVIKRLLVCVQSVIALQSKLSEISWPGHNMEKLTSDAHKFPRLASTRQEWVKSWTLVSRRLLVRVLLGVYHHCFFSSDSCFVDVLISLSWIFDEDRSLYGILSLCKVVTSNEVSTRSGDPNDLPSLTTRSVHVVKWIWDHKEWKAGDLRQRNIVTEKHDLNLFRKKQLGQKNKDILSRHSARQEINDRTTNPLSSDSCARAHASWSLTRLTSGSPTRVGHKE